MSQLICIILPEQVFAKAEKCPALRGWLIRATYSFGRLGRMLWLQRVAGRTNIRLRKTKMIPLKISQPSTGEPAGQSRLF